MEVSGIFPVGVAMRTCAVERDKGAVPELSFAVRWQERITRGAGQSYARGMPASTLSSEFCTVQVQVGPQNPSTFLLVRTCFDKFTIQVYYNSFVTLQLLF